METITVTAHTTNHDEHGDAWTIDLYTHGDDGYELFATVGTSEDDGDSEDLIDWVAYWATRIGYDVLVLGDLTTFELTPAPPARWTVEAHDEHGYYELLTTERYDGPPVTACGLSETEMLGEPDGTYRVTTWSAGFEFMDRAEIEVYDNGRKVAAAPTT